MEKREIKFRAWDVGEKIMAKVGTLHHDGDIRASWIDAVRYEQEKHSGLFYPGAVSQDWANGSYILMQYTGLKDKNGVEIYFGDIVEYETTEGSLHKAIINWNDDLCCVCVGEMPYPQLYQSAFIQPSKMVFLILGNIHQNPELCSV